MIATRVFAAIGLIVGIATPASLAAEGEPTSPYASAEARSRRYFSHSYTASGYPPVSAKIEASGIGDNLPVSNIIANVED